MEPGDSTATTLYGCAEGAMSAGRGGSAATVSWDCIGAESPRLHAHTNSDAASAAPQCLTEKKCINSLEVVTRIRWASDVPRFARLLRRINDFPAYIGEKDFRFHYFRVGHAHDILIENH